MDQTKIGAADFAEVCDIDAVDTIITDDANTYLEALCERHGVKLVDASGRNARVEAVAPTGH